MESERVRKGGISPHPPIYQPGPWSRLQGGVGMLAFTLPLLRLTFFTVSATRTDPSSLLFSFCSLGFPCSPM